MKIADEELVRRLEILQLLRLHYPGDARDLCELDFQDAFELLVATVLSAQCTDKAVNRVTPVLFAKYPDPKALSLADTQDVEEIIYSTGFFRAKAKNIIELANTIVADFNGDVPVELDDLIMLPGVGRKTANVVRPIAFGLPGLAVDTHVKRLSGRLGFTKSHDPAKIEAELCAFVPPEEAGAFSLRLILHGRRVCLARRPKCEQCFLRTLCPYTPSGPLS